MNPDVLVVDTSVIVKWLNQDNEGNIKQADKIMKDVEAGRVSIVAPELARYEVGNVLLSAKHLTIQQASIVLNQLYKIPITYIEDSFMNANVTFEIASEAKITYYDASFMALARQYAATLVTDNIKHQGKYNKIKAIALADY